MFVKSFLSRRFDPIIMLCLIGISIISFLSVLSATATASDLFSWHAKKHAVGLLVGWIIYITSIYPDYRQLIRWGYAGYLITLCLLLLTLIMGSLGMGARRWIQIGFLRFQPSELAKLFFPAFFTHYIFVQKYHRRSFVHLIPIIILLGISFFLIKKQPDLGTALLILGTGISMLIAAGLPWKIIIVSGCLTSISAPFIWNALHPYQQQRVLSFIGKGEKHKERYQIEQSLIAIGSGGIWGKGLLCGTQNKFRFLPEGKTDFIFSVWAEEAGFIGSLILLTLYLVLFFRLMYVMQHLKAYYTQLLVWGLTTNIALSTIINIGMVIGILPVVGIPLPFMSYGLTHIIIEFSSIGWIQSLIAQREEILHLH